MLAKGLRIHRFGGHTRTIYLTMEDPSPSMVVHAPSLRSTLRQIRTGLDQNFEGCQLWAKVANSWPIGLLIATFLKIDSSAILVDLCMARMSIWWWDLLTISKSILETKTHDRVATKKPFKQSSPYMASYDWTVWTQVATEWDIPNSKTWWLFISGRHWYPQSHRHI